MKTLYILLLAALMVLVTACAPAVLPAETADPAQMAETAETAVAPGLPNTCAVTSESFALRQECLAQNACATGVASSSGACPAGCPNVACPRDASCAAAEACPYAESCGEACPAAETCGDGCPYNGAVDEPACGVESEQSVESGTGTCLISYEMLQAATIGLYQQLTPAEAKARMDSGDPVIVVDVRTQAEYDAGHIPGAILVPNEDISDMPPAALSDLTAEILVYCRSGRRSKEAVEKLAAIGYTNVFDFGGINDWPYDTTKGA